MADQTTTETTRLRLSDRQRAAVEAPGPLMVLAGPGTGKTTVMVERLAHLVADGADPGSLLAITFTRKAAEEIRARLALRMGSDADLVSTENFNSFGQRLVLAHADRLGYTTRPRLIDATHLHYVIRHLILEKDLFRGFLPRDRLDLAPEVTTFVERMRNLGLGPKEARRRFEEIEDLEGRDLLLEACDAYAIVEAHCLRMGWMTFNDQIAQAIHLLKTHPNLEHPYRHVIVDECQDVNAAQITLLRLLGVEDTCMVGDDDQAIYAFRGSDVRAFDHLKEAFPASTVLRLTENRRSARRIVETSNTIIANATTRFDDEKVIEAHRDEEGRAEIVFYDHDRMHDAIVSMIREDQQSNPDRPFGQYAIIARSNRHLDEITAALDLDGLPWQFTRSAGAADVVEDLEAWITLLTAEDDADVRRLLVHPRYAIPPARISTWNRQHREAKRLASRSGEVPPTFLQFLATLEGEEPGIARFLETLRELQAILPRRGAADMIREIISASSLLHHDLPDRATHDARLRALSRAHRFVLDREDLLDRPGTLFEYAEYHRLLAKGFPATDDDEQERRTDAIQLVTAHGAKGLEFDVVFVLRVRKSSGHFMFSGRDDQGILAIPDAIRYGDEQDAKVRRADESRRLLYVACTRARHRLVLLAKTQKTNNDVIGELQAMAEPVPCLEAEDIIASDDGALPRPPLVADRDDALRQAELLVRLDAASVLDRAGRGEEVASELERAARRMSMIGSVRRGEALADTENDEFAEALRRRTDLPEPEPTFGPMPAPLKLSYTMLNSYARCARCMYVERVLGFRSSDSGRMQLGTIVHGVLEQVGRWQREADIGEREAPTLGEVTRAGKDAFLREWPAHAEDEDVEARIEGFLRQAWEMLSGEPQIEELEKAMSLTYAYRGDHRLDAKIDRIERLADGRYRIIDYKTGRHTTKAKKDDLQLGVYAMAMARWGIEEEPITPGQPLEIPNGTAEYWSLSTGEVSAIDFHELDLDKVHRTITRVIDGCLDGQYPRGSDWECSGVCRLIPD